VEKEVGELRPGQVTRGWSSTVEKPKDRRERRPHDWKAAKPRVGLTGAHGGDLIEFAEESLKKGARTLATHSPEAPSYW